jgi:hypothetical protein
VPRKKDLIAWKLGQDGAHELCVLLVSPNAFEFVEGEGRIGFEVARVLDVCTPDTNDDDTLSVIDVGVDCIGGSQQPEPIDHGGWIGLVRLSGDIQKDLLTGLLHLEVRNKVLSPDSNGKTHEHQAQHTGGEETDGDL